MCRYSKCDDYILHCTLAQLRVGKWFKPPGLNHGLNRPKLNEFMPLAGLNSILPGLNRLKPPAGINQFKPLAGINSISLFSRLFSIPGAATQSLSTTSVIVRWRSYSKSVYYIRHCPLAQLLKVCLLHPSLSVGAATQSLSTTSVIVR